jgi:hypothetical protein
MGVARWQRILLSGGLLEPGEGRRTVRDWVVDLAIFVVALASGVYVLSSTWDQHSPAVECCSQVEVSTYTPDPTATTKIARSTTQSRTVRRASPVPSSPLDSNQRAPPMRTESIRAR